MHNKSLIIMCLCGLTWAGTAQAGFLSNKPELQFLQSLLGTPSAPLSSGLNSNVSDTGINVTVGDTTLGVTVPSSYGQDPVGLNIVDINNSIPTITDATGSGNGDVSFGPNNVQVLNLSGGDAATLAVTLPEPGDFDLVALGLTVMGMTIYRRRRARA
ncbi:MAG: hypothetical protein P8164_07905 [Gammaproteobacteria bacterium]|jgi:hypothetical protein